MGTALVTGVTGQLGFYVAQQLAGRGDTVWGVIRQSTVGRAAGDTALPYRPITGDLLDEYSLLSILEETRPDRIFNFGAQSFIPSSWTQPILTAQYTALGVVRLLEAVRRASPHCRLLQAGSSELFAGAERSPQDEDTAIRPVNPYGIAKSFAYHTVRAYRQHYKQFATNAIFFTNESERRTAEFVFRKVTRGVADIVAGKRDHIALGNLDTVRDWGYAPEYAAFSVALLDLDMADDFVVATGEGHTVRELVSQAFGLVDLDWQKYVRVDDTLVRTAERAPLIGNTAKLERLVGASPEIRFDAVLRILLAHDLRREGCTVPFICPDPEALSLRALAGRRRG
ncbi:MAG TPA: GDP-mannose 4,6-dehydratase [Polyangia bacterium]|nr:GDP-mannose 4,6-dehydratase [Polyangia bacterium]